MPRRTVAEHGPHPVDVHVGGRVRLRRTLLGMSQTDLDESLGGPFSRSRRTSAAPTASARAGSTNSAMSSTCPLNISLKSSGKARRMT